MEHVLDGLCEVVGIDDKAEEIDFSRLLLVGLVLQQVLDLSDGKSDRAGERKRMRGNVP